VAPDRLALHGCRFDLRFDPDLARAYKDQIRGCYPCYVDPPDDAPAERIAVEILKVPGDSELNIDVTGLSPRGPRPIYDGDVEPTCGDYYSKAGRSVVVLGGSLAVGVDGPGKSVRVLVRSRGGAPGERERIPSIDAFLPWVLIEWFGMRGQYCLHGASVARDGLGLLLMGRSGAGKTTTALSFVNRGWDYLGDDTVFVGCRDGTPRVASFISRVKVTPRTLELIPSLVDVVEGGAGTTPEAPASPDKHLIDIRDWPVARVGSSAPLGAILFLEPRRPASSGTRVEELDPGSALQGLLPSSTRLHDPERDARRFGTLSDVALSTRSFRVEVPTPALLDLDSVLQTLSAALGRELGLEA